MKSEIDSLTCDSFLFSHRDITKKSPQFKSPFEINNNGGTSKNLNDKRQNKLRIKLIFNFFDDLCVLNGRQILMKNTRLMTVIEQIARSDFLIDLSIKLNGYLTRMLWTGVGVNVFKCLSQAMNGIELL
ncbi:hypothetical protein BpHYR1_027487 [Brachionus plicatilis]|uniref:Uncharacterized protein n=1 Tax=Brachionus plicatilis TaxID=10195 RepID=A0A3M7RZ30_BRAPC|nr:hypothetical protein BpHYR1_027487 [Brachionus plicatilis]